MPSINSRKINTVVNGLCVIALMVQPAAISNPILPAVTDALDFRTGSSMGTPRIEGSKVCDSRSVLTEYRTGDTGQLFFRSMYFVMGNHWFSVIKSSVTADGLEHGRMQIVARRDRDQTIETLWHWRGKLITEAEWNRRKPVDWADAYLLDA